MDNTFIADFNRTLTTAEQKFLQLSERESETPRLPGKWCPKEIIGHLIDSCANNHKRFVEGQFQTDMIFEGYDQDNWVKAQHYKTQDWKFLVGLWKSYNAHILQVIEHIPEPSLSRKHTLHNFHLIAWKTIPENQPVTLEYLVRDYLDHMNHHLRQIIDEL